MSILHDVGKALYGPRWQTNLAQDIGVSDRTMRRWAAGSDAMPSGMAEDLRKLCLDRATSLAALVKRLSAPIDLT